MIGGIDQAPENLINLATNKSTIVDDDRFLISDTAGGGVRKSTTLNSVKNYITSYLSAYKSWDKFIFQGRLTLTSNTPYPMSSVAGASTLYLTPLSTGNIVSLYESTGWKTYTLTQLSLTLTSLPTASRPYDIFLYDTGSALALEAVAWSSTTARATALATQDGIYVKPSIS